MRSTAFALLLALSCGLASAARLSRPATVSFPLFSGIIDLRTTPGANDPNAPATIPAAGLARRSAGYPAAPTLSVRPMERLSAASLPPGAAEAFSAAPLLRSDVELTPRRGLSRQQHAATAGITDAVGAASATPQTAVIGTARRLHNAVSESQLQEPQSGQQQQQSPRVALRRRTSGARAGFAAATPEGAYAGGGGAAAAVAASEDRAVHTTGGVAAVYSLLPGGARNSTVALIRLQDLFAPVGSSNCRDGLLDGTAVYDPAARRFYLAAACGGTGSALLAVSASAEPHAAWYLYNLPADGVSTRTACPNGESALVDYPRLSFNADALAVTVHSYCPTEGGAPGAPGAGATLLVLPKGTLARGDTRVAFAVFTAAEVADAAVGAGLAGRVQQLEPAVPQRVADVGKGSLHFVADVANSKGQARSTLLLVSLVNTGAMWGVTGDASRPNAPVPLLGAALVGRGATVTAPAVSPLMTQPEGAVPVPLLGLPPGFWTGRAIWTDNKVWAVDEAADPSASNTPTIAWAVFEPGLQQSGPSAACTDTASWGAGFDYSIDSSSSFGEAVQPAWEAFVARAANSSGFQRRVASLYSKRLKAAGDGTQAAGVVMDDELKSQLTRTDVSPFFIPSAALPRAAVAGARPADKGTAAAGVSYGGRVGGGSGGAAAGGSAAGSGSPGGGRGGFEGWSCWSCGRGKAGYYVSAAAYNFGLGGGSVAGYGLNIGGNGDPMMTPSWAGTDGYRNGGWGGGPFTNFGLGPYGGGYGTGGWAGGYFGGFFAGSNVGGVNWGSACQIMCQRAWGGTGGVFGWGTAVAPNGWGPFGALPGLFSGLGFGGGSRGWGGWFGRRLMEDAANSSTAPTAAAANTTAVANRSALPAPVQPAAAQPAASPADQQQVQTAAADAVTGSSDSSDSGAISAASLSAAAVAVTVTQIESTKAMRPVCVGPADTCAAAASATCPAGAEPPVSLAPRLVAGGVLSATERGGLSLAAPAAVVVPDGRLMVVATYSGSGRVKGTAGPAFPGLASLLIAPGTNTAAALHVEQRGTQAVTPEAARAGGGWPAPPAVAVQPSGGAALLTAERPAGSSAAPWVSVLEL